MGRGLGHFGDQSSCPDSVVPRMICNLFDNDNSFDDDDNDNRRAVWPVRWPRGEGPGGGRVVRNPLGGEPRALWQTFLLS